MEEKKLPGDNDEHDKTFKSIISSGFYDKIIIIGFPHDQGARRANFRIGANLGPDSFRRFFSEIGYLYNPQLQVDIKNFKICDYGNIIPPEQNQSIQACHQKLQAKTESGLRRNLIPFIVGGSRDYVPFTTREFVTMAGKSDLVKKGVIIVITPNFDMQPLYQDNKIFTKCIHRDMMLTIKEEKKIKICFFGLSSMGCGKSDYQELKKEIDPSFVFLTQDIRKRKFPKDEFIFQWLGKNQPITKAGKVFAEQIYHYLKEYGANSFYFSVNLEAVSSAYAPGVTDPLSCGGLTSEQILQISFIIGTLKDKLKLMDISEYNPMNEDYRTGKLLAAMLYKTVIGFNI